MEVNTEFYKENKRARDEGFSGKVKILYLRQINPDYVPNIHKKTFQYNPRKRTGDVQGRSQPKMDGGVQPKIALESPRGKASVINFWIIFLIYGHTIRRKGRGTDRNSWQFI